MFANLVPTFAVLPVASHVVLLDGLYHDAADLSLMGHEVSITPSLSLMGHELSAK
jgi:hypothetical protein